MRQQNVPEECWDAFWSRIEPMSSRAEFIAKLLFVAHWAIPVIMTIVNEFPSILRVPLDFPLLYRLVIQFLILAVPLLSLQGYAKNAQLEEIRTLCREEEERVFRRHGFALECDYEKTCFNLIALRLCFVPVTSTVTNDPSANLRNGHLRIEVVEWSTWNIVWMPTLAGYDSVPDDFETLSREDWSEFWSKMTEASIDYLSSIRRYKTKCFIATFVFFSDWPSKYYGVHTSLLLGFIAATVYELFRVWGLSEKRSLLVAEYAPKFAKQGVYMENRMIVNFQWWYLSCTCHYLDMFPLKISNLALLENESGPVKQEI